MVHSEQFSKTITDEDISRIQLLLKSGPNDAQLIIWGPGEDIDTALETIEERCKLAFKGVPNETRKSFQDGTTIFERVLPGADRMYPDTDSPPIPLEDDYIGELSKNLSTEIITRYHQLIEWGIPPDTHLYIFKKNLYPLIERIVSELSIEPKFAGTFIGHNLKFVEGHYKPAEEFNYKIIFALFRYLKQNNIDLHLAKKMLPVVYEHPKMDFESVLTSINFKKVSKENILSLIPFLKDKFDEIKYSENRNNQTNWIMGELSEIATGNINLKELSEIIGDNV